MKKTYMKPEIMFEDFSLCTGIAANCETVTNTPSSGHCGLPVEGTGKSMFTAALGNAICDIPIDDDGSKGFCYHVPVESNNLFNS